MRGLLSLWHRCAALRADSSLDEAAGAAPQARRAARSTESGASGRPRREEDRGRLRPRASPEASAFLAWCSPPAQLMAMSAWPWLSLYAPSAGQARQAQRAQQGSQRAQRVQLGIRQRGAARHAGWPLSAARQRSGAPARQGRRRERVFQINSKPQQAARSGGSRGPSLAASPSCPRLPLRSPTDAGCGVLPAEAEEAVKDGAVIFNAPLEVVVPLGLLQGSRGGAPGPAGQAGQAGRGRGGWARDLRRREGPLLLKCTRVAKRLLAD